MLQTLNTGSLAWATASAMAYLYMVMSWGGYSFIINLLPIHCLACVFTGRLSHRLYVAYAPLIVMGTIGAGQSCPIPQPPNLASTTLEGKIYMLLLRSISL